MLKMKRRDFLKQTGLAGTAMMMPKFVFSSADYLNALNQTGNKLVVIQLSGGNDSLNTVIPYSNDEYYKLRPNISIPKKECLTITQDLGFNPAMAEFHDFLQKGILSVITNVGYPNPDRSHFRSMDIWHTAGDSSHFLTEGWIGRYLDTQQNAQSHWAIETDDSLSLALKGKNLKGLAVSNIETLYRDSKKAEKYSRIIENHDEPLVNYLYKTLADTRKSAQYLHQELNRTKVQRTFPATDFGKDMRTIAELILSDCETRIYYTSLNGFDTHVNQKQSHFNKLRVLNEGLDAFVNELRDRNKWNEVTILVFSEFGRRVQQNASNGTDHGTAGNVFVISNSLKKPGINGLLPDLTDLDNGDLKYKIDFRSVYSELINKKLGGNANEIIQGDFGKIDLFK